MNAAHSYLPNALARLTTCDDVAWWRDIAARYAFRFDGDVVLGVVSGGITYDVGRLRRLDHADAVEDLVAAGLLPEHWLDTERAPRWWCERCEGSGTIVGWTTCECCGDGSCPCTWGSGDEMPPEPSRGSLVAVSSLGAAAVARAEEIIAETWRDRTTVWRVMTATELRNHHSSVAHRWYSADPGAQPTSAEVFTGLWHSKPEHRGDHWRWFSEETKRLSRACLALLDLGLHFVATDESTVTVAAESVAPVGGRWTP